MSMMENAQPVDEQSPSFEPPAGLVTGGSKSLKPGQKLRPREITGVAPEMVLGAAEKQYFNRAGEYEGQKLVDSKGVISREQYSEDEAYNVLVQLGKSRPAVLNILQQVGIYGKGKPDPGFSDRNLSAIREAMLYANYKGVTLDVAASLMLTDPEFQQARAEATSGSRIRTTAKQDLRAVFKQASQSILGRSLPDSEVERFIRAYQASEIREAQGGATAPSPSVAAEEQIMGNQGAEAQAVGFLSLANIMDRAIKELG